MAARGPDARREQMDYLRDVAAEYADPLSDAALDALCERADLVGQAVGLRSDEAYATWALFALLTNGDSLADDDMRAELAADSDPDGYVRELLHEL